LANIYKTVETGQQTKHLRAGETWSSTTVIFRFCVWFFVFKIVLLTGALLIFFFPVLWVIPQTYCQFVVQKYATKLIFKSCLNNQFSYVGMQLFLHVWVLWKPFLK